MSFCAPWQETGDEKYCLHNARQMTGCDVLTAPDPYQSEPPPDAVANSVRDGRKAGYKRLTHAEIVKIARLQAEGLTVHAIGRVLKRDENTIKRAIERLEPSQEHAKALLAAGASEMASRVVQQARPAECIDVLERLDVLKPRQSAGQRDGVQVLIGIAQLPGLPGQAKDSTVQPALIAQPFTFAGQLPQGESETAPNRSENMSMSDKQRSVNKTEP